MKKFNIVLLILVTLILVGCKEENQISLSNESSEVVTIVESEKTQIYVYITGQVNNPGVYQLDEGSRLFQAIELAGGMTKKAYKEGVNLASELKDGQSIKILSKSQYKKSISQDSYNETLETESTLININKATKEELMNLPGIGDTKAVAIVTYREENGEFKSIEDINNVSGIGDSTFANIKDLITID